MINSTVKRALEECDNTEYELWCFRVKRICNFIALGFIIAVSTALATCIIAIFSEIMQVIQMSVK